jgi:hypothetical protein
MPPLMSLRRSSVVAAFVFGVLAISACKPPSNQPKAYDNVTQANFIEGCTGIVTTGDTATGDTAMGDTATGDTAKSPSTSVVTTDGASSSVCKCEYNWFVNNVPFDQQTADSQGKGPDAVDFLELNQQLQDDPTSMPQDIQDSLNSACSKAELVTPNTGQTGTSVAPSGTAVEATTSTTTP